MSQFISPELVSKLTDASERIRRVTEELEQSVVAVEEFLGTLNLGIPAAVWIEQPDAPYRLTFGPSSDKPDAVWRLRLERIKPGSATEEPNSVQVDAAWDLREAPQKLLMASAAAVPNLVESIAAVATGEAERIESALLKLRGPSDEITIVDKNMREKLDRDFLDMYAKRMTEESGRRDTTAAAK